MLIGKHKLCQQYFQCMYLEHSTDQLFSNIFAVLAHNVLF